MRRTGFDKFRAETFEPLEKFNRESKRKFKLADAGILIRYSLKISVCKRVAPWQSYLAGRSEQVYGAHDAANPFAKKSKLRVMRKVGLPYDNIILKRILRFVWFFLVLGLHIVLHQPSGLWRHRNVCKRVWNDLHDVGSSILLWVIKKTKSGLLTI